MCNAPVRHWHPNISAKNESIFEEGIKNTLESRYDLKEGLKGIHSKLDSRRFLYEYPALLSNRICRARSLIKDPFALFSAGWHSEKPAMDVARVSRHAAAVACSLQRLNWAVPFEHFLDQPLLIRDHLCQFEAEIREHAEAKQDAIEQAILLRRLV